MDRPAIQDEWIIIKERLKQRWAELTDDDLEDADQPEELLDRIQRRTGESRDGVQRSIREYLAALSAESPGRHESRDSV